MKIYTGGNFGYGLCKLFLFSAIILFLQPAQNEAARLRLVTPQNTAWSPGTADTTVNVGDTVYIELWLDNTDTNVVGAGVYVTISAGLTLADIGGDSFLQGTAGIQIKEHHASMGDIFENQGVGDTHNYSSQTYADSVGINSDILICTYTLVANSAGTQTIVFNYDIPNNRNTVITNQLSGTDVLIATDTAIIVVTIPDTHHLLFSEVYFDQAATSNADYVEILNPTSDTVNLDNYYLSDDVNRITGQGNDYAKIKTGLTPGSGDFVVHFPAGTQIGPGETLTVALRANKFLTEFPGVKVDFEVEQNGAANGITDMISDNINGNPNLTDAGEVIILFYWNGSSDLVKDVDIVAWEVNGTPDTKYITDKTGLTVGGGTYKNDSVTMIMTGDIPGGLSFKRINYQETNETFTGGNGLTGHDETTENLQTTDFDSSTTPTPWHTMLIAYKRGDYPAQVVERLDTSVLLLSLHLDGARYLADTLTKLSISNVGNMNDTDIDTMYLYLDVNGDSALDAGDTLMGVLAFNAGTGRWETGAANITIPAGGGRNFIIVADISDSVSNGETFQAQIDTYVLDMTISDSGSFAVITNGNVITASVGAFKVTKIQDIATSTILRGDVNVEAFWATIVGDPTGDTISYISIANIGGLEANTDIINVKIWEDNGTPGTWDALDTLAGVLIYDTNSNRWETNTVSYFISGNGETFIFTFDVSATADYEGDSFQFNFPVNGIDGTVGSTGPAVAVLNSGYKVLANPAGIANHVVISEVYYDPVVNEGAEFIEIYNPTDTTIEISSWTFVTDGGNPDVTINASQFIQPRSYYLIGDGSYATLSDNSQWPAANEIEAMVLGNVSDGIYLADTTGRIWDAVGWGDSTAINSPSQFEKNTFADIPAGFSLVRKARSTSTAASMAPGGRDEIAGNAYDSYDNSFDFVQVPVTAGDLYDTVNPQSASGTREFYDSWIVTVDTTVDIADRVAFSSETNVTVIALSITGGTGTSDLLNNFAVSNIQGATTTSVDTMTLWIDANNSNNWDTGDTYVSYLIFNGTDRWETTGMSQAFDYLGASTTYFIVTISISDTPISGDTFQAQVDTYIVKSAGAETGPAIVLTNPGIITITVLNPVLVSKNTDISDTVSGYDTRVTVMAVSVTGSALGDTLTTFAVENLGTLDDTDLASVDVWIDINGNFTWDAGDILQTSLAWDTTTSRWDTSNISMFIGAGTNVVITIDLNGNASNGETFQAQIPVQSITATVNDSGPITVVTNNGLVTIDIYKNTQILITEVSAGTSDWVEFLVVNDGVSGNGINLAGWYFDDLDGADKIFGDTGTDGVPDQSLTAYTGNRILLIDTTAGIMPDETDTGTDNIITIYGQISMVDDDQAVLFKVGGSIVDAVCFSDRDGSMTADVQNDMLTLINAGEWQGDTTENSAVSLFDGAASWSSRTISRDDNNLPDSNTLLDWNITYTQSQGTDNGPEEPITTPGTITINSFIDIPNDQGGQLQLSWKPDTSLTDFYQYNIYIDTQPITSLTAGTTPWLRPEVTITDSSTASQALATYNQGSSLVDGDSYWVAITITDTWGHEQRVTPSNTGPVVPVDNISGTPVFLVNEVYFMDGGAGTDYVEIRCMDDGNPAGAINIAGYDFYGGTNDGVWKTLGAATIATGEYLLIQFNAGATAPDEADTTDGNADGVLNIYSTTVNPFPTTDEGIFFRDASDSILDFVFYSNRDGTFLGGEDDDLREALNVNQWTGDTVQNAGVRPLTGSSFPAGSVIARDAVGTDSENSHNDWNLHTVQTPGTVNPQESPITVDTQPTVTQFTDNPNDLGGNVLVVWNPDTSIADFFQYNIYISTQTINRLDTSNISAEVTITDSSTGQQTLSTINGQPLVNGESYYVTVTIADTWSHETTTVVSTGPVAPIVDVTGNIDIRISEVKFSNTTAQEYIELVIIDDGNPTGNLNMAGFKLEMDTSGSVDQFTFGALTVSDSDIVMVWTDTATAPPDEADSYDGNTNLVADVYTSGIGGMPESDEGITLKNNYDTILDYVYWSGRDGGMTAEEIIQLGEAIAAGAWTGTIHQNNGVNPIYGTNFSNAASISRDPALTDSNSRYDWGVDSTPTPGSLPDIENPNQFPDSPVITQAIDNPNDLGGQIRLTFTPTTATDFIHYNLYVETSPLGSDLSVTDTNPSDYSLDNRTNTQIVINTIHGQSLVNGESYYIALTAVDTYGNENKLIDSTGPVVPVVDVVGESIVINEVAFNGSSLGHDFVEFYCIDDGNGGAGLNLNGFTIRDRGGVEKTLGAVTMASGEYMLYHYTSGTDEVDTTDGNADGIIDIYTTATAPFATDDNIGLYNNFSQYEDFVCWADMSGGLTASAHTADSLAIIAGQWIDQIPLGVTEETDAVDGSTVAINVTIKRQPNSLDSNDKSDWVQDTTPTPGYSNDSATVYVVDGAVNLEGRVNDDGCSVLLFSTTDTYGAVTNTSGTYTFTGVIAGNYTLRADTNHYLVKRSGPFAVNSNTTQNIGLMYTGDADDNNMINILDASITKVAIDSGNGDVRADHIDPIGVINSLDLDAIRPNFGRIGDP